MLLDWFQQSGSSEELMAGIVLTLGVSEYKGELTDFWHTFLNKIPFHLWAWRKASSIFKSEGASSSEVRSHWCESQVAGHS